MDAEFPWYPGATRSFDEGVPYMVSTGAGRYLVTNNEGLGNYITLQRGSLTGTNLEWVRGVAPVPWENGGTFCLPYDSPRLAHDAARGVTYLTYARGEEGGAGACNTRIELLRSSDEGLTWSAPLVLNDPARTASQGAQPVVGPDGELVVVWRDHAAGDLRTRRSEDGGLTFGPETVVARVVENQSPALMWSGRRMHPVRWGDEHWMPDFPAVAVDRSIGPNRGRVYVAWAEGPEYVLPAASGTTSDSGPNDLPESAQPFALGNDIVGFVAGSQTDADCDYFSFNGVAGQVVHVSGSLTFVAPSPGGSGPGGPSLVLMHRDPVDSTFFAVAGHTMPFSSSVPPGGPIVTTLPYTGRYVICAACGVFYSLGYHLRTRLLTPSPTSLARDHRDLVMVSSGDGGRSWTPKRRLGDAPVGYDESLPALAVDEAGRLHAAWYDRRDGARGLGVDARWAVSLDGGLSWLPSVRVSGTSGNWLANGGSRSNIGDRIALAAGGGRAHVVWVDGREQPGWAGDYELYTARVDLGVVGIAVPRFEAQGEAEGVRVRWWVADDAGVTGFRVHREGEAAAVIASVEVKGEGEYEAFDTTLAEGASASYRLEVLRGGTSEWLGPVSAERPAAARTLSWSRVGPSPFVREVTLVLALPREGHVSVRVHDLAGREVARLHEGALAAGSHAMRWSGEDTRGGRATAGVYLVRALFDEAGQQAVCRVVRVE